MTVVTGSKGKVRRVNIDFRVNCRGAGGFRDGTQLTIRRRARKYGRFSSRGSYRYAAGVYTVGVRVFSRGKLRPDGLFTGDVRVKMRIELSGRFITRCRIGKTGWSAKRFR